MPGPHDALFKAAFEQPANAAALVRRCLSSELQARFDWSTMRLLPGSFVDPELRASHSDLVFVVASFAGPVLVYVLLEHQSSNDVRMTLRVLCYMDRLWARHARECPDEPLPPILPLIISNAPNGWTSPIRFGELFPAGFYTSAPELVRHLPDFELLVDDLCRTSDDELSSRALAHFAKVALWLLRDGRVESRLRASMPLWVGLLDRLPKAALEPIVHYLARLVGERVTWDLFRANLQQLAPNAEGTVMSPADQWFAEGEARGEARGRAEGEARGRAEGEARGRAALLAKQLTLKLGELPEPVRERLLNANIDELDRWAERVLVATSFADVFAD